MAAGQLGCSGGFAGLGAWEERSAVGQLGFEAVEDGLQAELEDMLGGGVDAQAVIDASEAVYPGWLLAVSQGRIYFTIAASLAVIVLLITRPARDYFRK